MASACKIQYLARQSQYPKYVEYARCRGKLRLHSVIHRVGQHGKAMCRGALEFGSMPKTVTRAQ